MMNWESLFSTVPGVILMLMGLLLGLATILMPLFVWQIYRDMRRTRIAAERAAADVAAIRNMPALRSLPKH